MQFLGCMRLWTGGQHAAVVAMLPALLHCVHLTLAMQCTPAGCGAAAAGPPQHDACGEAAGPSHPNQL